MKVARTTVVAGLLGAATVLTAGAALAQSDGVYNPADQRCDEEHTDTANAHDPHDDTERCQNATVFVQTGDWEVVRAGTLHTEEGQTVNHAVVDGDFNPEGHTPGASRVYFGADDNLSRGEHDGASGMGNGPSDGGGGRSGGSVRGGRRCPCDRIRIGPALGKRRCKWRRSFAIREFTIPQ